MPALSPDPMPPESDAADTTRFVLVEASHPGNVGAAARAMKVMGFGRLVLVAPRFADVLSHPEAPAMASGAGEVLEGARVAPNLDDALDGITFACATAMTPRDFGPPTFAPRALFASLAAREHRVAFVFGSERHGLANDVVYRCHACLSIPTAPGYGSLNLAQAVQLVAYDWRQALGGFSVRARTAPVAHAGVREVQDLLRHWRDALTLLGYFDPVAPRKLMWRLNRLVNRAEVTREELQILRGIASSVTNRLR